MFLDFCTISNNLFIASSGVMVMISIAEISLIRASFSIMAKSICTVVLFATEILSSFVGVISKSTAAASFISITDSCISSSVLISACVFFS